MKWQPTVEQIDGVEFLLRHACAGVLLNPGTFGKTAITLEAIRILLEMKLIRHVLVLAPIRVCQLVWPAEIKKWANFSHLSFRVLHGKNKERDLAAVDVDIYITNYESMPWLLGYRAGKIDASRVEKFDLVVLDELSKFKNHNTQRFKMMKQATTHFKRRWGLTGSPAPRGYENLFGQCYVLDEGRALGRYITQYRSQYFCPKYNGFGYDLRPGAEKEIQERIRPLMFRREPSASSSDMPELREIPISIQLDKATRKICTDMQKNLLTVDATLKASLEWVSLIYEDLLWECPHLTHTYDAIQKALSTQVLTAANVAVALQKCRQIASGAIYSNSEVQYIHNSKLDALSELIEELQGQPLLVIYEFKHELARIRAHFGKGTPYLGSGVSPKQTVEIEKAWNAGDIPLLLGHPAAMGHGLNLQGSGNNICWFSLTQDYELWVQTNGRLLRRGLKHKYVTAYVLLAEGTVDAHVYRAIQNKGSTQEQLLAAMLEHI